MQVGLGTRLTSECVDDRLGHPLVCFNDGECKSTLRILRAAATHFPVLRAFLQHVYSARRSHSVVFDIDKALCAGDFQTLMTITETSTFEAVFSNSLDGILALTH